MDIGSCVEVRDEIDNFKRGLHGAGLGLSRAAQAHARLQVYIERVIHQPGCRGQDRGQARGQGGQRRCQHQEARPEYGHPAQACGQSGSRGEGDWMVCV